jgi:hypothetical protein
MKEDWVMVLSISGDRRAKVAKLLLQQYGIESHILRRSTQTSALTRSALYTPRQKATKARSVLHASKLR